MGTGELSGRPDEMLGVGGGGGGGGGNLVMDWHPFQGRVVILLVMSCYKETGMSSGRMGHVARMQTLPFH